MTAKKTAAKKTAAPKKAAAKPEVSPTEKIYALKCAESFIKAEYPVGNNMKEDRFINHAEKAFDFAESMVAEAKRRDLL
tara:strand:+ start:3634 stop:3870 length:237 start_codon:yes stop_codon:yes gene_type:complete